MSSREPRALAVSATTGDVVDAPGAGAAVRVWLLLVAALVFCMIVVGGATRLTDSGLSITEWQPILGAIPPLNEADWLAAFDKYKAIPEYTIVNKGMSLEAFKAIYWWEWAHRFLGRFIGVAFALPFVAFWLMGELRRGFALQVPRRAGAGRPAGRHRLVHGEVGPRRSHRRQPVPPGAASADGLRDPGAARLAGAGARAAPASACGCRPSRCGSGVRRSRCSRSSSCSRCSARCVAGLKAGLTYNTWPLMDGKLVPDGLAHAVAVVSQLLRERHDGAVQPSRHRLRRRGARPRARSWR